MKLKAMGATLFVTISMIGSAYAIGHQEKEIIECTENSCLVRTCTTIGGSTHCSLGWEPKRPNWGPGHPSEQ